MASNGHFVEQIVATFAARCPRSSGDHAARWVSFQMSSPALRGITPSVSRNPTLWWASGVHGERLAHHSRNLVEHRSGRIDHRAAIDSGAVVEGHARDSSLVGLDRDHSARKDRDTGGACLLEEVGAKLLCGEPSRRRTWERPQRSLNPGKWR